MLFKEAIIDAVLKKRAFFVFSSLVCFNQQSWFWALFVVYVFDLPPSPQSMFFIEIFFVFPPPPPQVTRRQSLLQPSLNLALEAISETVLEDSDDLEGNIAPAVGLGILVISEKWCFSDNFLIMISYKSLLFCISHEVIF